MRTGARMPGVGTVGSRLGQGVESQDLLLDRVR